MLVPEGGCCQNPELCDKLPCKKEYAIRRSLVCQAFRQYSGGPEHPEACAPTVAQFQSRSVVLVQTKGVEQETFTLTRMQRVVCSSHFQDALDTALLDAKQFRSALQDSMPFCFCCHASQLEILARAWPSCSMAQHTA